MHIGAREVIVDFSDNAGLLNGVRVIRGITKLKTDKSEGSRSKGHGKEINKAQPRVILPKQNLV